MAWNGGSGARARYCAINVSGCQVPGASKRTGAGPVGSNGLMRDEENSDVSTNRYLVGERIVGLPVERLRKQWRGRRERIQCFRVWRDRRRYDVSQQIGRTVRETQRPARCDAREALCVGRPDYCDAPPGAAGAALGALAAAPLASFMLPLGAAAGAASSSGGAGCS